MKSARKIECANLAGTFVHGQARNGQDGAAPHFDQVASLLDWLTIQGHPVNLGGAFCNDHVALVLGESVNFTIRNSTRDGVGDSTPQFLRLGRQLHAHGGLDRDGRAVLYR